MNFKKRILLPILAALLILSGVTLAVLAANEGTGADTGGDLDVYKCNLSFRSNVCIKYAIATEDTSVKMLIWRAPQTEYIYSPQTTVLAPVATDAIDGKSCLIFDYTELAAADMTEVVYARAYKDNGDGTYEYGAVKKYSILQYAYNKLGYTGTASTDEELKQMLRDMLVYGASAQKYLERNTDRLATADFYQVVVEGGLLADGCTEGLYLAGETVTLIASATNAEGGAFSHWVNSAGETIGSTVTYALTVPAKHDTYTAVYGDYAAQYSEGLAFTSNGDGTCYVSGIGSCTDLDVIIPPTSPAGDIVTGIGDKAFLGLISLTNIKIPERVESIGFGAFASCVKLMSINIPANVVTIGDAAFNSCGDLTSIEIPAGVTNIMRSTFSGCTKLVEVWNYSSLNITTGTINNGSVGENALIVHTSPEEVRCVNTTDDGYIFYENGNTVYLLGYIGNSANLILPENHNGKSYAIYKYAFEQCLNLSSITIPVSVTSIGQGAFRRCSNLKCVCFANESQLMNIDAWAFESCSGLTNIDIPTGVMSIGHYAFSDCSGLTSIRIPVNTTSIFGTTFAGCNGLSSITVDVNNTIYHSAGNCVIETTEKRLVIGCKSSVIPTDGTVTSIGLDAFSDRSGLTSIVIPDGVTSIGASAFEDCSNLTSITIPASVTSIDQYVFSRCYKLVTIDFQGTEAQWETVAKGNRWDNEAGSSASAGTYTVIFLPSLSYSEGLAFTSNGDGTCYVSGIGSCTDLDIVIPPVSPDGDRVTSIGEAAFYNCSGLTSIEVPTSVTSIGGSAFSHCNSLISITLPFAGTSEVCFLSSIVYPVPSSLKMVIITGGTSIGSNAFSGCSGLTSITIPDGVTSIGDSAFSGCSGLTSITIPDGVTSIGGSAFRGCSGLTSITIPDGVTSIGGSAFSGCSGLTSITIPDGVTSIGGYAFYGCSGLTSITLPFVGETLDGNSNTNFGYIFAGALPNSGVPSSLKTVVITGGLNIDDSAFSRCSDLASITISASVRSIGEGAFSGCSGLTSVIFAEGSQLTSIGEDAFARCRSLTSIEIPAGVTSIGFGAFLACEGLVSLTIPTSVMNIDFCAFQQCSNLINVTFAAGSKLTSIKDNVFAKCESLKSIEIPAGVTSIGEGAFSGCSSLTSIIFAEGSQLTDIGQIAFSNCSSLTSVIIPSSVTSIGYAAFRFCSELINITIPSSVTIIRAEAFYGCSKLTSITFENTEGWYYTGDSTATSGTAMDVSNPATNATNLVSTYRNYYWKRS